MGGNGINGGMKIISWTGGVVALLITIYATFHVPLSNALQETKAYCASEDTAIRKELAAVCLKNSEDHSEMKTMLAEIKTELRYIRKENGRPN
jgi:hypothetical protein